MKAIEWSPYLACSYVEGFGEGEGATMLEQIEALAYLVRINQIKNLQGFYGRYAQSLIEAGIIDQQGNVDHERINSDDN